jgi:hypothetical protein
MTATVDPDSPEAMNTSSFVAAIPLTSVRPTTCVPDGVFLSTDVRPPPRACAGVAIAVPTTARMRRDRNSRRFRTTILPRRVLSESIGGV